jgi:tetrahydromethanopterin S-methyltransferase subunit F
MKCFYYLSPTLADTQHISDDLKKSGVSDWFIHIISKNEAELERRHLHSSNYLETMDFLREGLIGAAAGLLIGLVFAWMLSVFRPFGSTEIPLLAYAGVVFLLTCFGAWQGGLVGISTENKKLRRFHNDIEAGKYLMLVYAHKKEESRINAMMERLHPEAKLVGLDARFYNPFADPKTV